MSQIVLLLGAEGCSESQDCPYVRDATPAEIETWKNIRRAAGISDSTIGIYMVDTQNRPYWFKAINIDHPDCPDVVKDRVKIHSRLMRLAY